MKTALVTPLRRSNSAQAVLAICFGVPLAVLAGAYLWLALDHGTFRLWPVVVHESGRYTLGETVLYFSHFLREIPTLFAYVLFLLGASGAVAAGPEQGGDRRPVLGWALLAGAAALVAGALLWSAVSQGPGTALADLFQFRTRDDASGYGTHWRFHWLSTLWFGAAAGMAPLVVDRLLRAPVLRTSSRWTAIAWIYFTVMTVAFGLSEDVFLDLHFVGHQAREILTHGPVTLLLGVGILLVGSNGGGPSATEPPAVSGPATWFSGALLIGIPAYLAVVSLSGDVLEHGQTDLGLSAMVAAHVFEHSLDYLLVLLLLSGAVILMDPRSHESHAMPRITPAPHAPEGEQLLAADQGLEEDPYPRRLDHAVSLIIPAFNEGAQVARQVREVASVMAATGWNFEIIVVDDGSSDGTGRAALAEGVRVLRNRRNRGYGASILRGVAVARHDWILIIDADGTYPASAIPELLARARGHEMVVGARITGNRKIPLARRPAKWFLTRLASYLARRRLPDLNSGLRLIRRDLIETYAYLMPSGFSFTTTITLAAACNEHEVAYVPIDYHARVGDSKIRPAHAFDFLLLVLRIIVFFNPLRVFVPIGAFMAAVGLAKLAYDLTLQNVSESALLGLLGALIVWAVGLLADQNARIARRG